MDTLSHALWGGVAFGKDNFPKGTRKKKFFWAAFFLGAAPDLLSFGPTFFGWMLAGFPPYHRRVGEPPPLEWIPSYVFTVYNITHSILVWLAVFFLLRLIFKKPPWIFCAWLLHILCDIPTHTTRYFPTPFLWPFDTPFVNGIRWATPYFLIPNYILLATAAFLIYIKNRRDRIVSP